MALYTEKTYKDISEDWERIQALEKQKKEREEQEKAQRAYEEQQRRAQASSQAQAQQKKGGLEGILAGIGESLGNVGHTVYNMFGNGLASIGDLTSSIVEGRQITDRSDGWKEHMKGVYGDKNMSDKDYYNRTGGKALDAAATVSEFIPGVGVASTASKAGTTAGKVAGKNLLTKAAINAGQGAVSGIGQHYANNGESATLEDALKAGSIGAAAGTVGTLVGNKLGSMAAKSPAKGAIGKAVQSNIGRSAITGATSGATGGALGSAMYGGDIFQGALEGAGNGALGGATTGAVYGAIGALGNKAKNKIIGIDDGTPKTKVAQTADEDITPGQKRRQTPMDWGENDISGQAKKRNYFQKLGKDLEQASENIRNYPVNSKLKGNLSGEVALNDTLKTLREKYGYTPDDLDRAAILSTGVNKWYNNEIESSGATKVNTRLADDLALPANSPLSKNHKKAYSETIQSVLDMANSGNSNVVDEYSAAGLAKADKFLTKEANKLRRTNMNGVDKRTDPNLELLADAYDSARGIISGEMMDMIELDDYTRQNLAEMLKNTGAPEQAQNAILSAKNFREIKTKTAPLELARKMQTQMKSSPYKRSAAGDNSASLPTQIVNATGVGETMQAGLKPVREVAATANGVVGKAATAVGNALAGEGVTGKVATGIGNTAKAVNNGLNGNIGTIAMDRIARQAGINEANNRLIDQRQAETRNELDEAEANYNTALANYQAAEAQAQQVQSQGAAQLQQISDAMNAAMAAGDFNAYSQLANLYKQAYSIYGSELEATNKSNEAKALTATQAKALTGLQQVEALENMTPDLGAKLSQTPLSFLVNLGGGNEYTNQSQSLALTLGYLQSGANITPREAENIGKSYIPSPYDSEEVRRNKLARARQLLQNYLGDTTALEQ